MSIASKLVAAIAPVEAEDAATATALDNVRAARALIVSLETRAVATGTKISGKKTQLADSALAAEQSNDLATYNKIAAELVSLEAEATRIDLAQVSANRQHTDAEAALHTLGVQSYLKMVKRKCTASSKTAASMVEHLAGYARDYLKLLETRDELIRAWPVGSPPNSGGMLFESELAQAVQTELTRIHPIDPLSKAARLPGAVQNAFENPFTLEPFLLKLETANSHLIKIVEAGPK